MSLTWRWCDGCQLDTWHGDGMCGRCVQPAATQADGRLRQAAAAVMAELAAEQSCCPDCLQQPWWTPAQQQLADLLEEG